METMSISLSDASLWIRRYSCPAEEDVTPPKPPPPPIKKNFKIAQICSSKIRSGRRSFKLPDIYNIISPFQNGVALESLTGINYLEAMMLMEYKKKLHSQRSLWPVKLSLSENKDLLTWLKPPPGLGKTNVDDQYIDPWSSLFLRSVRDCNSLPEL